MHPLEVEQKLKAEKDRAYNDNMCGQTVQGIGYANQPQAIDECSKQEPLIYRLQRRARNVEQDHAKLARVLDILQRHPEFEEFLEVLRSDLI
jgi:hypothetical protein